MNRKKLEILKLSDDELILVACSLFLEGFRPYEIASKLGWSASNLSIRIKSITGLPPSKLRRKIILEYLYSGRNEFKNYTEISAETGIRLSYLYTLSSQENQNAPIVRSAIYRQK